MLTFPVRFGQRLHFDIREGHSRNPDTITERLYVNVSTRSVFWDAVQDRYTELIGAPHRLHLSLNMALLLSDCVYNHKGRCFE